MILFICSVQVVDQEKNRVIHYLDATNPGKGNWMRYINCARWFEEQNIVTKQEGYDIYYRAIRVGFEV